MYCVIVGDIHNYSCINKSGLCMLDAGRKHSIDRSQDENICIHYIYYSISSTTLLHYYLFRTGILPLEIETGRYVPIFDNTLKKNRKRTANEHICKLCRLNDIENEYHFLCVCPVYNSRRKILFEEIELKHVHFHTLSSSDKFIFVIKHCQIEVSKFINEVCVICMFTTT